MKLKKILAVIIFLIIFSVQILPVWAVDAPQAPNAPSAPVAPVAPSVPSAPVAPEAPTLEEAQNSSASNESQPAAAVTTEPTSTPQDQNNTPANSSQENQNNENTTVSNPEAPTNNPLVDNNSIGTNASGNVGDTLIDTGDATSLGTINTQANTNISTATPSQNNDSSSANIGNGVNSDNNSVVTNDVSTNTIQDNTATVVNDLNKVAVTGQNNSSLNVGNTTINTGDANTSGNIITGLNTNLSEVMLSEFNIVDDYSGDFILDFNANCISGCTSVQNANNGANSQNTSTLINNVDNNTFQTNDATLENNLTLNSDSGNNDSKLNTNGDSTITTGDANAAANIFSFLNNNVAGNVVLGVVNIFGNLIGDIIMPEDSIQSAGNNSTVANANNGAASVNDASISNIFNSDTFQNNNADIENNLVFQATTGANDTNFNTGGNSSTTTGEASVETQTINIANSNVNDGGDWWLVIVNKAGEWVGKILGAPEGSTFAGSQGTEFKVGENGEVTATNTGNGTGSNNSANINNSTNNTTVQDNNVHLVNNVNINANTGGNDASFNTGGDSTIKTGDAKIIANIVNFVNNNIVSKGKLVVTTINVFGEWVGDFISPGMKKENKTENDSATNTSSNNESQNTGGFISPLASNTNTNTNNVDNTEDNNLTSSDTEESSDVTNDNPSENPSLTNNLKNVFSGVFDRNSQDSEAQDIDKADVKAVKTQKDQDGKKKVNINLAWGLAILPIGSLMILTRSVIRRKFHDERRINK